MAAVETNHLGGSGRRTGRLERRSLSYQTAVGNRRTSPEAEVGRRPKTDLTCEALQGLNRPIVLKKSALLRG